MEFHPIQIKTLMVLIEFWCISLNSGGISLLSCVFFMMSVMLYLVLYCTQFNMQYTFPLNYANSVLALSAQQWALLCLNAQQGALLCLVKVSYFGPQLLNVIYI